MKKKQKISRQKASTSRGVLFSFILAATTAGFAFGALAMSYAFPLNLSANKAAYTKGAGDVLSELLAIGAFGKEEIRNISGEISAINGNKINFKVFSPDKMSAELSERIVVLTPETKILLKKKKTQLQTADDNLEFIPQIEELNKKIENLKKLMADCNTSVNKEECSALRVESDILFRKLGDINSQKMSPYVVYSGQISDLKGRVNISVVANEDIVLKKTIIASSVELVEIGE